MLVGWAAATARYLPRAPGPAQASAQGPTLAVPLAPGVWRIPLLGDLVNCFVLRDDDGQVTRHGCEVLETQGPGGAGLDRVGPVRRHPLLLTHAHPDPAGGAAHVAEATGRTVGIHEEDASYAEAGHTAPRDQSFLLARVMTRLFGTSSFPAVTVGERLVDGQVLDVAGELVGGRSAPRRGWCAGRCPSRTRHGCRCSARGRCDR